MNFYWFQIVSVLMCIGVLFDDVVEGVCLQGCMVSVCCFQGDLVYVLCEYFEVMILDFLFFGIYGCMGVCCVLFGSVVEQLMIEILLLVLVFKFNVQVLILVIV